MTLSPTSISNILPPEFKLLSYKQIASLWSNYGHIYRLTLDVSSSTTPKPLILKAIHPPSNDDASESHLRKLLSYKVERWFYHHLAPRLRLSQIKVSKVYLTRQQLDSKNEDDGNLFLEDLSTEFPFPADGSLGKQPTLSILDWLAGFHGTFFTVHGREALELVPPPKEFEHASTSVKGVWRRGTYWYLDTRREELSEMNEEEYSWLMPWIAKVCSQTQYITCLSTLNMIPQPGQQRHRQGDSNIWDIASRRREGCEYTFEQEPLRLVPP